MKSSTKTLLRTAVLRKALVGTRATGCKSQQLKLPSTRVMATGVTPSAVSSFWNIRPNCSCYWHLQSRTLINVARITGALSGHLTGVTPSVLSSFQLAIPFWNIRPNCSCYWHLQSRTLINVARITGALFGHLTAVSTAERVNFVRNCLLKRNEHKTKGVLFRVWIC
jgi:hypothetical protein